MATVLAYARYAAEFRTRRAYAAALAAFALGLLAKPMLVTLPIVLLLLDRWPLGRPGSLSIVREKAPFFLMAFASAVVTWRVQQAGGAVAQLEQVPASLRIANAFVAVPGIPSGRSGRRGSPPSIRSGRRFRGGKSPAPRRSSHS
jgi:hypothetical protein